MIIETSNDAIPPVQHGSGRGTSGHWTLAGRYRLDEPLGAGGMGEVWGGRDLWLKRAVAVKLLRPGSADPVSTALRFTHEARAMASLNHPNVVTVHDVGEHEGEPYLVMEQLPGRTLADELEQAPLPVARVCAIVRETLAGLGAAHAVGLIHRDVKPGNILFTATGMAKLGDFGIAKVPGQDLTRPGEFIGTWQYQAPELIAGEPATPQSDIYAVGVIMYIALSGRRPFGGETLIELARSITLASPTPLRVHCPDLDPAVEAIVEQAMSPAAARRFGTAEAMIAVLGTIGAEEVVGAAAGPRAPSSAVALAASAGPDAPGTEPDAPATEPDSWPDTDLDALVDAPSPVPLPTSRRVAVLASVAILAAIGIAAYASGGDGAFIATGSDQSALSSTTTAAGVLAEVQRELDQLEDSVGAADDAASTDPQLSDLADEFADLADQLGYVSGALAGDDLDAARTELAELVQLVDELDGLGLDEDDAETIRRSARNLAMALERTAPPPTVTSSARMSTAPSATATPVTLAPTTSTTASLNETETMIAPTTDKPQRGNGRDPKDEDEGD